MGEILEQTQRTVQVEFIIEEIAGQVPGGEGEDLILYPDKAAHSIINWKVGSGIVEAGVGSQTGAEEVECQEVAPEADTEVLEECVVDVVPNGVNFEFVVSVMKGLQLIFDAEK
jgi:hypothetical protein